MPRRKLLTAAHQRRLLLNGLRDDRDHFPIVKIFTPDGATTWLLAESDPDDPDRLFGLCDLGLGEVELGYVSLTELQTLRGRLGLPVERDAFFVADKPLSAYATEAKRRGAIVA